MTRHADTGSDRVLRRRRQRSGAWAERLAAAYLMAKGYRVLAMRCKTHAGEIDIVAVRGSRLAFVEVKYRKSLLLAQSSITPNLRRRVRRAADIWLARKPRYQSYTIGFDLIFLRPWHYPHYIENGL